MGDNTVGRIRVRVLPDTRDFNRDLKKVLQRAEARHDLRVPVRLDLDTATVKAVKKRVEEMKPAMQAAVDLSRKSVEKAKRSIEAVKPRLQAELELAAAQKQKLLREAEVARPKLGVDLDESQIKHIRHKLKDEFDKFTATINADLDSGMASARLKWLCRPRKLPINVEVNGIRRAATMLAALSGGRVLKDFGEGFKDFITNLDRSVPKIAAATTAIAALGAVGIHASGGLIALAGSIAKIVPAGLALPGILTGMAAGASVMVMALKDAKTELESLGPGFTKLQDDVSAKFWGQAAEPIKQLANNVLPVLRRGLGQISVEAGKTTAALAGVFTAHATNGSFATLFANTAEAIRQARGGLVGFVDAFSILGTVGSSYLPKLAAWTTQLGRRFARFIDQAADSGKLTQWIDSGVEAIRHFGGVIAGAAKILAGLHKAAAAAGGGGLAMLNGALNSIADVINSEAFQHTLVLVFKGAADGAKGLAAALGPIGGMLNTLGPALSNAFATLGQTAGTALTAIANALNSPAIAHGLTRLVDGFSQMVNALAPAMPPLADVIAALMPIVGDLAATIGQVLAQAIIELAPIVVDLANKIQPLIPVLGDALKGAIDSLTPVLQFLVDHLDAVAVVFGGGLAANAAVDAFSKVADKVSDMRDKLSAAKDGLEAVKSSFSALKSGAASVAGVLKSVAVGFVSMAKSAAVYVAQSARTVAAFIAEKIQMGINAGLQALSAAKTWLMVAAQTALNVVMAMNPITLVVIAIAALVAGLVLLYNKCETFRNMVDATWQAILNGASAVAQWFSGTFVPWLQGVWDSICQSVQSVVDWFANAWETIKATAGLVWDAIVAWVGAKALGVYQTVCDKIQALKDWWATSWDQVKQKVSNAWDEICSWVTGAVERLKQTIQQRVDDIKARWMAAWDNVKNTLWRAWENIKNAVSNATGSVVSTVRGLGGRILGAVAGFGSLLFNAGRQLINGMIRGISSLVGHLLGQVANIAKSVVNTAKSWLGIHSPSRKFAELGRYTMAGYQQGLEKSYGKVTKSVARFAAGLTIEPDFGGPGVDLGLDSQAIKRRLSTQVGADVGFSEGLRPVEVNQYITHAELPKTSKLASQAAASARLQSQLVAAF